MVHPKWGPKREGDVLLRVGILGLFCPKQGQVFIPSAAPLYPNIGQVPLGTLDQCTSPLILGEDQGCTASPTVETGPNCQMVQGFLHWEKRE